MLPNELVVLVIYLCLFENLELWVVHIIVLLTALLFSFNMKYRMYAKDFDVSKLSVSYRMIRDKTNNEANMQLCALGRCYVLGRAKN
mgnify:CR=1 FL=1